MEKKIEPFKGSINPKLKPSSNEPKFNNYKKDMYASNIYKQLFEKPVLPEYKPMRVPDIKDRVINYKTPEPYCPPKMAVGSEKVDPKQRWFSLPKKSGPFETRRKLPKQRPKILVKTVPEKEAIPDADHWNYKYSSQGTILRALGLFMSYKPSDERSKIITANTVGNNYNNNNYSNNNNGNRGYNGGYSTTTTNGHYGQNGNAGKQVVNIGWENGDW